MGQCRQTLKDDMKPRPARAGTRASAAATAVAPQRGQLLARVATLDHQVVAAVSEAAGRMLALADVQAILSVVW